MSYALKTSDDLLVEFKRDAFIASQGNYTDSELLAVGDRMVLQFVVPLLMALPGSWYQTFTDVLLSSTNRRVSIPRYASYNTIKKCELVDAVTGNTRAGLGFFDASSGADYRSGGSGTPAYYELLHNEIAFDRVPSVSDVSSYRLRVYHPRRPSRMVLKARSTTVVTANTTTGVVTTATTPADLGGGPTTFDYYASQSPFARRIANVTGTALNANTMTIAPTTAALLSVGDTVCLEDETIYPDLPIDLFPHLCDLMALQLSKSKTDAQQVQIWQAAVVESMRNAMQAAPGERVKGQRRKLSLLRSGLLMGGRRFPRQVD